MPVKQLIPYTYGTFFITFTCHKWLPIIEKVNGYDIIYNWFNHLISKGHFINGFVIMSNHIHVIASFIETNQSINTIIGNGKRFMAYEIIKRLKEQKELLLLQQLSNNVEAKRKAKNKLHEVWELSFDWKECRSTEFINQKLSYIHSNPCVKKWELCKSPVDYQHSSAQFYISGSQSVFPVTNFMEMEDVEFTKDNRLS